MLTNPPYPGTAANGLPRSAPEVDGYLAETCACHPSRRVFATGAVPAPRCSLTSVRTLRPLLDHVDAHTPPHAVLRSELPGLNDDDSCDTSAASDWARDAAQLLGEPALGVRAARSAPRGWGDLLELTCECAPTLRAAILLLVRHASLAWEAADFHLHARDHVAVLRLGHSVGVSHVLRDFVLASLLHAFARWLGEGARVDAWLSHTPDRRGTNYSEAFRPFRVLLGTSCDALVFSAALLEAPPREADRVRHTVLMRHVERRSAHLTAVGVSLSERVGRELAKLLGTSDASIGPVAHALGTNARALSRRLVMEGTTFSDLLNEARKTHVLHYLESTSMSPRRIALAVGYRNTSTLGRAFRQWTGCSPMQYRRGRRDLS